MRGSARRAVARDHPRGAHEPTRDAGVQGGDGGCAGRAALARRLRAAPRRVPKDHPLRVIWVLADAVLTGLSSRFAALPKVYRGFLIFSDMCPADLPPHFQKRSGSAAGRLACHRNNWRSVTASTRVVPNGNGVTPSRSRQRCSGSPRSSRRSAFRSRRRGWLKTRQVLPADSRDVARNCTQNHSDAEIVERHSPMRIGFEQDAFTSECNLPKDRSVQAVETTVGPLADAGKGHNK